MRSRWAIIMSLSSGSRAPRKLGGGIKGGPGLISFSIARCVTCADVVVLVWVWAWP